MNLSRRQMLILLPAAAVAWKSVLAGSPEESPNYKMSDHWWGMLVDIDKCIGCGNCVRACATRKRRAGWTSSAPGWSATTGRTGR
jgi:tetrathionate reductase subunit B